MRRDRRAPSRQEIPLMVRSPAEVRSRVAGRPRFPGGLLLALVCAVSVAPSVGRAAGGCGAVHTPQIARESLKTDTLGTTAGQTRISSDGSFRLSIFNSFGDYDSVVAEGRDVSNDPKKRSARINATSFSLDWGAMDRLTLSLQVPLVGKFQQQGNPIPPDPDLRRRDAFGLGDLSFGASVEVLPASLRETGLGLVPSLAVSFPTGNVDEDGDAAGMLPQPFQLGSGAYELRPGALYYKAFESFTLYGTFNARIPLERNRFDYEFGREYNWTAGAIYPVRSWNRRLRLRFEVDASIIERDNFRGSRKGVVNALLLKGNGDVKNTGGEFVYLGPGLELQLTDKLVFSFSGLIPVLTNANGDKKFFTKGKTVPQGQLVADYFLRSMLSIQFTVPPVTKLWD